MQNRTCAIIVAAGKSTRMGTDKQRITIAGQTVIERCLNHFQDSQSIHDIVVVTAPESIDYIRSIAPSKVCAIVEGGCSRQESVSKGIVAAPDGTELVAIHDGARPFASPLLIEAICQRAIQTGAAVPVVPITSTVKKIDKDGKILSTVDRDCLRLVQTPQVFRLSTYKDALRHASGTDFTDDCQLFEQLNLPVSWVDGEEKNIKITTPDDLLLAQLISQRMEQL